MDTALYIVWFLVPAFFFGVGLWATLEKLSNKARRENAGDFFVQGIFVLICSFVTVLIDSYLLQDLSASLLPDLVPLEFYRIILFPAVLLIAGALAGPSKAIKMLRRPDAISPKSRTRKGSR